MLNRLIQNIGRVSSWLTVVMIVVLFSIVILRYVFNVGWIAMQESVLWLHAMVFLLAASWTLQADKHVRVDVFYRQFSAKKKALVNLIGHMLFLLPVAGYMLYSSLPYVSRSWKIAEKSVEAGGLPAIYILKTLIPVAAVLLLVQGLVLVYSSIRKLKGLN